MTIGFRNLNGRKYKKDYKSELQHRSTVRLLSPSCDGIIILIKKATTPPEKKRRRKRRNYNNLKNRK
jgi:hypothetical protein